MDMAKEWISLSAWEHGNHQQVGKGSLGGEKGPTRVFSNNKTKKIRDLSRQTRGTTYYRACTKYDG